MDAHGWADVNALPAGIGKKYPINRDILEEIVRSDSKQRYAFNEDRTLIRANQGHSIQVDVGLTVTEPPEALSLSGRPGEGAPDREAVGDGAAVAGPTQVPPHVLL